MKTHWKKIVIVPLLLALAVAPGQAQTNSTNTANTTNSNEESFTYKSDSALTPPAPQAPAHSRKKVAEDQAAVRIDSTGVHVGGKDLPINLPGLKGGFVQRTGGNVTFVPPKDIPQGVVIISVFGIVTPFVFGLVIVCFAIYFRHRRNRMLHETLRSMIDKGVPIPPELIVPPQAQVKRRTSSDMRNGLVTIGAGIGLLVFQYRIGWICVFIGLAFLIAWKLEQKQNAKDAQFKAIE